MKRKLRWLTIAQYVPLVVVFSFFGSILLVSGPVSATKIPNSNLATAADARKYIEDTPTLSSYMVYKNGGKILYRPNADPSKPYTYGNDFNLWTEVNGGKNANEGSEVAACTNDPVLTPTYIGFKFTARSNHPTSTSPCSKKYLNNYMGGRISRTANNRNVPLVLYIVDIDGASQNQRIYITKGGIKNYYTANNSLIDVDDPQTLDQANDSVRLESTGNLCPNDKPNDYCAAIVVVEPNKDLTVKIAMRSPGGYMRLDDVGTGQYSTLTLNPNGGSLNDSGSTDFPLLLKSVSGSNSIREYKRGTTVLATHLPTPTRVNYIFGGWFTSCSGGTEFVSTSMLNNETLCAHWTSIFLKTPNVHVQGGDLRVIDKDASNRSISTTNFTAASTHPDPSYRGNTYGSWAEYGAFSLGVNNRISSGAPNYDPSNSTGNRLTFTNTVPGLLGNFNSSPLTSQNLQENFVTSTGEPRVPPEWTRVDDCTSINLNSPNRYYNCDVANINLPTNANLTSSVIIKNTGTITIQGDLTRLNTTYGDIKNVPQLVIMANKIHIEPSVETIDAWLITTGPNNEIDTCLNAPAQLTIYTCTQPLQINGPVQSTTLHLKRTYGAERGYPGGPAFTPSRTDKAAETFNLRPDTYHWLLSLPRQSIKIRTNGIHELPPRY